MNKEFEKFLAQHRNARGADIKAAAAALGVSFQFLYALRSGKRRMTRGLAEQIEIASGGKCRKEKLLWPK